MDEKREKCGLALRPSVITLCNRLVKQTGVRSRNDFVEQAIEFYADFLTKPEKQKQREQEPWKKVEHQLDEMGTALSRNQYKIAVELAKVGCLLSSALELKPEDFSELDERCRHTVAHRKGTVRLQDLIDSSPQAEWKRKR